MTELPKLEDPKTSLELLAARAKIAFTSVGDAHYRDGYADASAAKVVKLPAQADQMQAWLTVPP